MGQELSAHFIQLFKSWHQLSRVTIIFRMFWDQYEQYNSKPSECKMSPKSLWIVTCKLMNYWRSCYLTVFPPKAFVPISTPVITLLRFRTSVRGSTVDLVLSWLLITLFSLWKHMTMNSITVGSCVLSNVCDYGYLKTAHDSCIKGCKNRALGKREKVHLFSIY